MIERDEYPPGAPCWVDTAQPGPEAAADFYGKLFGWEFEDRMPADSPGRYFVAQLHGRDVAAVGSQPEGAPPAPAWNTYIAVESADAAAARVKDAGGTTLVEPFDVLQAGRTGVFADPSGAVFCVWQAGTHKGAQLVNEPGTWNWSTLNTRDIEGSKAFYGAVFGWEATMANLGQNQAVMWRLPGYAEFLERKDPGLRQRHALAGAPEGFSDSIAWMAPMTSDQFPEDAPAHWGITFAVDDADAVATRALDLGGKVAVPPFDAPFVRAAVLSDPHGATFTINRYVPAG